MRLTFHKIAAVALLIGGCSSVPTSSVNDSWSVHSAQIASLDRWQVQGKLGFKSASQGGSANLSWSQNQQQYELSLSGPFGAGSAVISGNSAVTHLHRDSQTFTAMPEQLALQLTGLPIPVDALSWWARGLPSPSKTGATNLVTTADGTAAGFDQAGWRLAFSRYSDTTDGTLPRKIVGQFGEHSFKLLISRWSFPEK